MTRLHLRPKAQIKVRRHPAGGGNAHLRCMESFESRTHAKSPKPAGADFGLLELVT